MSAFWEMVIPAATAGFIFTVVFGFFAFMRYMRYKETIALAERGLLRPARQRKQRSTLKWGVIITSLGIGLICSLLPIGLMAAEPEGAVIGLILGGLPTSFGLGLIFLDRINQRHARSNDEEEIAVILEEDEAIPPHKMVD